MTNREVMTKWGVRHTQVTALRNKLGIYQDARTRRRATSEVSKANRLKDVGFTREMAETMSAPAIARATGITIRAVEQRRAARGWQAPARGQAVKFDEDLPDPTTEKAFDELFQAVAAVKAAEKKYDPRRHRIGVKLPGDKPIGFVFSSDWQLGSEGVDYELWRKDMEVLRTSHEQDPEGLYGIGLGDYQSALSTLNIRGSQHRDVIRAGDQYRLVKGLMHLMKGFWLVLLTGCHDTFTTRAGDIDPVEEYCRISGARHGWHGVELTITMGQEKYVLRLRHRFTFNSRLNPLNSQRRQLEFEGPADVAAHAHFHTSLLGEQAAAGRESVVLLRSGSYQIHDDFARQVVGNVKADPRFPMVILWPGRHHIWSVRDFKEGLDYLAMLRKG